MKHTKNTKRNLKEKIIIFLPKPVSLYIHYEWTVSDVVWHAVDCEHAGTVFRFQSHTIEDKYFRINRMEIVNVAIARF